MKDYGRIEKSLEKKYYFLHGEKLRAKSDKVFCKVCDHDNGIQCLYDILLAQGVKVDTKYPCGKAKAKYDEMKRGKK